MKLNFLDRPTPFNGLLDCNFDLPGEDEVEAGKEPCITIDAQEFIYLAMNHRDLAGGVLEDHDCQALYIVDMFSLIAESIDRDAQHGPEFQAEQADVTAEWLEFMADRLRKKYPK